MQDYEARQEARKERYEARAEKLRAEAQSLNREASEMADAIPFGQPILVGHHSEKRDRRYRERIHDTFGRAYANEQKADYYEAKARAVGSGGISSDDPKAVEKLRAKLASLQKLQSQMKTANAILRKFANSASQQKTALMEAGFSEKEAIAIIMPNCFGASGFMPFELANNNANIRRIVHRISSLEKARANAVTRETECAGFTLREDAEENRIMFIFDGKPEEEVRNLLKSRGFRWSPTRGAWVRMLNANGRWAAQYVRQKLEEI